MDFNQEYSKIKQTLWSELSEIEKRMISDINIREPLNSHIKEFLLSPSKRIRSVIPILYTKALGQELNNGQFEVLSAVELVHNASLIHDDIIDESLLRRSKKTTCAQFGNKLAVIAGDYLLSEAMEKIITLNSKIILKNFTSTLKNMCIGEINQNFDRFKIGTIDEYIEKTKRKTAYLFATSIKCCLLSGEKEYDYERAGVFGLNLGIAFQIRDDLINITKTDFQKPSGSDIKDGIYNAPVIYAGSVENYAAGIEKTKDLLNNYVEQAKLQVSFLPKNEFSRNINKFLELLKYD